MSGLNDFLKDVPVPESSTGEEPEANEDPKKGTKERTPEEVRGELLRKQEKFEAEIMGKLADISSQLSQSRPEPTPQPSGTGAKQIEDMSYQELESMRGTIDWEKVSEADKSKFEALTVAKRAEEAVDQKMQGYLNTQKLKVEQDRYLQKAVSLHPDLTNPTSELAQEVDRRIRALDQNTMLTNPRIVLDLANEVSIEKGITPKPRRTVEGLKKSSNSRSAPLQQSEDDPEGMMTDEERAELARKFERRGALPKGKKFDLDEIKEDERKLRKNLGLHIKQ